MPALIYDNLNQNIKLKQARINVIEYILKVWYDNNLISKNIIVNSFQKAGIINNSYTIKEEDEIIELYSKDLNYLNDFEIIDDLSPELKFNSDDLENFEINSSDEESEFIDKEEEIKDKEKKYWKYRKWNDLKKEINNLSETFKEYVEDKIDIDFDYVLLIKILKC